MIAIPELADALAPLVALRTPPDATSLRPDNRLNAPPSPLVPLPTLALARPPPTPSPRRTRLGRSPLLPEVDAPALNTSRPLAAPAPTLDVPIRSAPPLPVVPSPGARAEGTARERRASDRTPGSSHLQTRSSRCPRPAESRRLAPTRPRQTRRAARRCCLPWTSSAEHQLAARSATAAVRRANVHRAAACGRPFARLDADARRPSSRCFSPRPATSSHPNPARSRLPTETRATPARPPTLGPEPRATAPLFPSLDDPELNANRPPDPLAPLFVDPRLRYPLLEQVPSPLIKFSTPPDINLTFCKIMLRPAFAPLVPLPPLTIIAPLRPPDAVPESSAINPVFPDFADPELNDTHPLDPAIPMAPLRTARVPLLADEPPEVATTPPPLCSLPLAACTVIGLPAPLIPLPTCKSILPPQPAVAEPEPMATSPVFPVTAEPELNASRHCPCSRHHSSK